MSSDVAAAIDHAEDAFDDLVSRDPHRERGLRGEEDAVVQLRKGCRLLDACRALRANDGYYTSVSR